MEFVLFKSTLIAFLSDISFQILLWRLVLRFGMTHSLGDAIPETDYCDER